MTDRKSWTEVALMPIKVALVGFGGTYFITEQQESNAETQAGQSSGQDSRNLL